MYMNCLRKILLVDDEKDLTLSLADMLEANDHNYQVRVACNGLEALQIIRSTPIDLVATDLCMPQMNGFELLEILRLEYPTLPVIVWSTYATPDLIENARKMGAIKFIALPLDLESFYNTVKSVMDDTRVSRSMSTAQKTQISPKELPSLPGGNLFPMSGEEYLKSQAAYRQEHPPTKEQLEASESMSFDEMLDKRQ